MGQKSTPTWMQALSSCVMKLVCVPFIGFFPVLRAAESPTSLDSVDSTPTNPDFEFDSEVRYIIKSINLFQ